MVLGLRLGEKRGREGEERGGGGGEQKKKKEEKKEKDTKKERERKKQKLLTCPISCPALVTCTLPSWWIDTIAGFASTLITNLHAAMARAPFHKQVAGVVPGDARGGRRRRRRALSRAHIRGTVYLGVKFFFFF